MVARLRHPSARRHVCDAAARERRDPTGTIDVRRKYALEVEFRWRKLRSWVLEKVGSRDILGLNVGRIDPATAAFRATLKRKPGDEPEGRWAGLEMQERIKAFQQEFDEKLGELILERDGAWLEPMVGITYTRAVSRAKQLTSDVSPDRIAETVQTLRGLAVIELQGIMEAVSQRAVRVASQGMLEKKRAVHVAQQIVAAINKVGLVRSRAMVSVIVVKAHAQATLDQFAAAGVSKVGILPEHFPAKRRRAVSDASRGTGPGSRISREEVPSASTISRIRRAQRNVERVQRVEVLTAGDEDVCPICEDIAADGPYTIDEARSLIPAHPECRCAFVPAEDERFAESEEE